MTSRQIATTRSGSLSAATQIGLAVLPRWPRLAIGTMLAWSFLHPSVHYYLGQAEVIAGAFGVTWAGLIDVLMFGFGTGVFLLYLVSGPVPRPFLMVPTMIYLVAQIYALVISPVRFLGIRSAVVGTVPILFALNVVILARRVNLSQTVTRVVVLSSLFPMLIASLQILSPYIPLAALVFEVLPANIYALTPYPGLGIPRAFGSMENANEFAMFMSLIFLAVLLRLDHRLKGTVQWVWLGIGAVIIFATFTRAVWLSLLGTVILTMPFMGAKMRLVLFGMVILFVGILIASPAGELLLSRLSDAQSLIERGILRDYAIQLFLRNPMGYGHGMSRVLTTEILGGSSLLRGDLSGGPVFHNEYATHAVEGGIIWLGAYLSLLLSFLALAMKVIRLAYRLRVSPKWGVWLGGMTLMISVIALTDTVLLGNINFAFWMLIAGVEMEYRAMKLRILEKRQASASTPVQAPA